MSKSETEVSFRDAINTVLSGEITDDYDGRSVFPVRINEDRTLRLATYLHAINDEGLEVPLELDGDGNLRITVLEGVSLVTKRLVDPVAIPNVGAAIWTPGLAATVFLDYEVFIVNMANPAANVTVGMRVNVTGGTDRYLLRAFVLNSGYSYPLPFTVRMGGNDVLWAECSAGTSVEAHIRVTDEGNVT